ncbi:MAG: hypothetical protein LBJ25_03780 [Candidatus Margulisbacteria bacterium]|jgi:hypothetical protein|nr:hypothetical protein [Candidatus Margulisiibacteriota bacterium]
MATNNYTDNFEGTPYFIKKGEQLSAAGMTAALNTREKVANKATSLSSASTDIEYPSAKAVYDALAEAVRELETQVHAANNALSGKQDSLPIGAILMYDGASWQDNVTLPGWYSCNRTNYNNGLTPDLEDKFIKGKGALANTGGSNALTAAMLPLHNHELSGNTGPAGEHSHDAHTGGLKIASAENINFLVEASGVFSLGKSSGSYNNAHWSGLQASARWGNINATHNSTGAHTHALPSATADNDGVTGTNASYNNMPLYYSVIYIIKVTAAEK